MRGKEMKRTITKFIFTTGIMLMLVGASALDSESLLLPGIITSVGILLTLIGGYSD